jgi:hypothetical protein
LHIAETAVIAVHTGKIVEEIANYVGVLIVVCCGKIGNRKFEVLCRTSEIGLCSVKLSILFISRHVYSRAVCGAAFSRSIDFWLHSTLHCPCQ